MGYFSESKYPDSLRAITVNMVLIRLQGFHLDESEDPPVAEHVSNVTAMNISSQRGARVLTFLAKEHDHDLSSYLGSHKKENIYSKNSNALPGSRDPPV